MQDDKLMARQKSLETLMSLLDDKEFSRIPGIKVEIEAEGNPDEDESMEGDSEDSNGMGADFMEMLKKKMMEKNGY